MSRLRETIERNALEQYQAQSLQERLKHTLQENNNNLVEAQRLEQRTRL